MNFKEEIFKSMQTMANRAVDNCKVDRTYESVIKEITPKGYVELDRCGCERTVQCGIPGLALSKMQRVWVKEPMGDLKRLYICGMI
jgi:hypothetical protein